MNHSEEWRFLWPASQSSNAPPVIPRSCNDNLLGPLAFQPVPSTLTTLLSSPSVLSPPCLPPLPTLSLNNVFESSYEDHDSFPSYAPYFSNNRLQPLSFADGCSTLVFFPTGDNLDQVGFVLLKLIGSQLLAQGDIFLSRNPFGHRILQLAARESSEDDAEDCLGFLAVSTMYSVHFLRVLLERCGTDSEKPVLDYIGRKLFNSSVACVCWSPHLPEECLVLLENGKLFLYVVASSYERKKLPHVSWDSEIVKAGEWLSCEFSWHPQIVVIANSNAVFLVDFRCKKCTVDCLLSVGSLNDVGVGSDRFLAFSKVGLDGFHYVVVSQCWLVLIDVRVLCKPMLQWMHNLQYPCNVSVFSLSRLRGNLGNDEYNKASKLGYGIVLSSFWSGDFNLFCFGPYLKQQPASSNMPIKASQPFYAWDLPSDLLLSGRDCPKSSSSCLLKQESVKDFLPEWIDWQLKKQLVLGFIILGNVVSTTNDDNSGFMLVRLMSSGKLESQLYNICGDHSEPDHTFASGMRDFHLLCMNEECQFDWKLKMIKLVYLYAYMNGSLSDAVSQSKRLQRGSSLFDDLSPSRLVFEDSVEENLGSKEMHAYAILKQQCEKRQRNFTQYADFSSEVNI